MKKVTKKNQPVQYSSPESLEASAGEEMDPTAVISSDEVQSLIPAELKRLNKRLDQVESKVEDSQRASSYNIEKDGLC